MTFSFSCPLPYFLPQPSLFPFLLESPALVLLHPFLSILFLLPRMISPPRSLFPIPNLFGCVH